MWVLLKYRKDLFLKNGLLYQKVMLKTHSEPISQFVLPKNVICKVILACHDDSGHLGMERTLRLLQERFFWPKMAENVWTHICTCDRCIRFKQSQEKSEMQPILVSYPLELVHFDFLMLGGKMDDSKSINVLIVTDHFTKYVQAYVTPKQTAVMVARTLPTHAKKNWQEWIATLTHAYNCTVSSVTGFSPYFLMFGRTPRIPLDIEMGVTLMDQEPESYQNYAKKLQARLKWAYQKAQENSRKESEWQKKYYDKKWGVWVWGQMIWF